MARYSSQGGTRQRFGPAEQHSNGGSYSLSDALILKHRLDLRRTLETRDSTGFERRAGGFGRSSGRELYRGQDEWPEEND